MPRFNSKDLLSDYVNNVRIEATSDNVFIDFGMADPFESRDEDFDSEVRARIVMNHSTFSNFAKHVDEISQKMSGGAGQVILSRCPTRPENLAATEKKKDSKT